MAELDLLTEMHTDIKYIKQTLVDHVTHDETISREKINPLWESHQQRKGAAKLAIVLYTMCGGVMVSIVDFFVKGHH